MKKLFQLGNRYAKESDWRDFALIKLCLCAIGVIIGVNIKPKYKKPVILASVTIFISTYIPLMAKLFIIMGKDTCGEPQE